MRAEVPQQHSTGWTSWSQRGRRVRRIRSGRLNACQHVGNLRQVCLARLNLGERHGFAVLDQGHQQNEACRRGVGGIDELDGEWSGVQGGRNPDQFAAGSTSVTMHGPAAAPELPAAVEVAAYRIVSEALTNAVRHAHARSIAVTVSAGDTLEITVVDDGDASGPWQAGVGMVATRERGPPTRSRS